MPRETVNTSAYHVPSEGFSQAIRAPMQGEMLFISGLTARTSDGTIVGIGDAGAQAWRILEALKAILAEAGATFDDVVRIVTYVRNIEDLPRIRPSLVQAFGNKMPASTAVQISRLVDERQLLEIEATAVIQPRT